MELEIGKVIHYYNHLNVAVVRLVDSLKLGDKIHILGHVTDFIERVDSMEVNYHPVMWVRPGEEVAIKVKRPVHEHDMILRIIEEALEPEAV